MWGYCLTDRMLQRQTSKLLKIKATTFCSRLCSLQGNLWRRRESNSCPNIFFKSLLHAYSVLLFRELTGNKQPINSLAVCVFCCHHSLWQQHPVLLLIGRRSGQQDCLLS